ncbi:MAG: long-chain fatty acid--CoA ligase [Gammaproteobacteria bacterium]|jgi:fatty-acyl-CoA synthase|nr:long-chain fatty acid--CoA ligase [Gammaproteobacteria bacterium]
MHKTLPADRQAALEQAKPAWNPLTLDQALSLAASEWPENEFVVSERGCFSYRALDQWVTELAVGLVSKGVRKGDHVALLMANYPEFVALKFAIARAGAVAVPINFMNRRDELKYVLEQSEAVCLITMDRFRDLNYLDMLDDISPEWSLTNCLSALPKRPSVFVFSTGNQPLPAGVSTLADLKGEGDIPKQGDPASVSDIIYTSGTTGGPKGVMLTHDMLLRAAYGSAYARAFVTRQRILFSLPLYHVYGYVEGLLAALQVGGAVVIQEQFDPDTTLQAIDRYKVDDVLLIPTMTLALLEQLKSKEYPLSSLKSMLSSGGKAPEKIWEDIYQAFGAIEVTTGYGMTEATASSTVTRPDDPVSRLKTTNGRLRDVGVAGESSIDGKLVRYRVVDVNTNEVLKANAIGELRMKGIGVTAGYYNKPEETAAAFDAEGWFRTGDLGVLDEQGYITLKGRTKESYRCGGELVLPLEVESVLTTHEGIAEAHVVAFPDDRMGEVGVACIISQSNAVLSEEALADFCRSRMARFKVPRHFLFLSREDIPVTPTGRPRKFLLAQLVPSLLTSKSSVEVP